MKAKLHSIYSTDVDDLQNWQPLEHEFAIPVRLLIGAEGMQGEESFDIVLCNASWLHRQVDNYGPYDARYHIVIAEYDWPMIERFLYRKIESCMGDTWSTLAERLGRFGHWEFEDYDYK
jgi:hypothetical protein